MRPPREQQQQFGIRTTPLVEIPAPTDPLPPVLDGERLVRRRFGRWRFHIHGEDQFGRRYVAGVDPARGHRGTKYCYTKCGR